MTVPAADPSPAPAWPVTTLHGSAASLHALDLPESASRAVWVLVPERPALVLGSTQADTVVDPVALAGRGIDLARRRSGGAAVLLDPAGEAGAPPTVWIDLVVPRADPLWDDDIGRSMGWLGEAWVRALAGLGLAASVHRGPLARTAASALVCFAGLGPGEVVVGSRKVVGISQRRTRAGARFQCVVHIGPEPPEASVASIASIASIVELLGEPAGATDRDELTTWLRQRTGTVPATADAVIRSLVSALP